MNNTILIKVKSAYMIGILERINPMKNLSQDAVSRGTQACL